MQAWVSAAPLAGISGAAPLGGMLGAGPHDRDSAPPRTAGLAWTALSLPAQLYVAAVIIGGAATLVALFPATYPQPILFAVLTLFACLTSVWKVNLPITSASGSTLSVSYAANLMALLLLGPRDALIVAIAGVWTQCTFKVRRPYPLYRTLFSVCAEVLTMAATGIVYQD